MLDREDSRQRDEGPRTACPESSATTIQGALRHSEPVGGVQDGGSAERPVQSVSQEPVGERVRVVSYVFQQLVHASDVNAPEDGCVQGGDFVIHAPGHIGCERELRTRRGQLRRAGPSVVDERSARPVPVHGLTRVIGGSPISAFSRVYDSRCPRMPLPELREFPPGGRTYHRADHAGGIPHAKDRLDSSGNPQLWVQSKERRCRLAGHVLAVAAGVGLRLANQTIPADPTKPTAKAETTLIGTPPIGLTSRSPAARQVQPV